MTTIYKLTDENMKTYNNTQWVLGEERTASGNGDMCGPGYLHAYTDPDLAILLNPIHAKFENPRLFRGEAVVKLNDGLKLGCTKITLTDELELPIWSIERHVIFAILCTKEMAKEMARAAAWLQWSAAKAAEATVKMNHDIDLTAIAKEAKEFKL